VTFSNHETDIGISETERACLQQAREAGWDGLHVSLSAAENLVPHKSADLVALDDALQKLAELDALTGLVRDGLR
jgi:hypothetical protein